MGDFSCGEFILLVDERDRRYLLKIPVFPDTGKLKGEFFGGDLLCSQFNGGVFVTPKDKRYLVFKPTLRDIIINMPRAAQIIYPKDLANIVEWGDIFPGMYVAEVGCGHGALTMTLLRCLGSEGKLDSYDLRQDHINKTRKNIEQFLGKSYLENWTSIISNPSKDGFKNKRYERIFIDIPEPWAMIDSVLEALCIGGIWIVYVPTVNQMGYFVEKVNLCSNFSLMESFEILQRYWHVKGRSVRPNHNMRAHTGFIITCRRRRD